MALLDFFRRPAGTAPSTDAGELFDDEFQKKLEMLALVSRKVFSGVSRANRRSKKKGGGIEFADHRNYSPGDDFRFVDWAVYRRFGKLLLRLYEEEEDLSVYFIVDCSRSMTFGAGAKFTAARRICAALAYVALSNLDRVTVVGVGDSVTERLAPTRGKQRIFAVLRFLRELHPANNTNLGDALRSFAARHKRRGIAVLLSDLYDPAGLEQGINVLRYNRFEPYVVHIVDPQEESLRQHGDLTLVDCESGQAQELTLTESLKKEVALATQARKDHAEEFCTAKRIPYVQARVDLPFEEVVFSIFRRGGFLS